MEYPTWRAIVHADVMVAMKKPCLHCGLDSESSDFCCLGCRTAYDLIHSAGLEAVYARGDKLWKAPNSDLQDEFEIFGEVQFLNQRAPLNNGVRFGVFSIEGIVCASCIWVVERLKHWHPEILEVRVDFGRSLVHLRWKEKDKLLLEVSRTLSRLGYRLLPHQIDENKLSIPAIEWIRLGIAGASAAGAMHIGLILLGSEGTQISVDAARYLGWISGLVASPALLFGGTTFFKKAWHSIRMGHFSSDLLIALAIIVGSIRSIITAAHGQTESYFDALAMIIFLLLGGRILVRLASSRVVQRPLWVVRRKGRLLPANAVSIGDICEVKTGEIIPLDGCLESEEAWIDMSSMTGEPLPVRIVKGQKILQGSSANSSFIFRVEQTLADSSIERMLKTISSPSLEPKESIPWEAVFTISILVLSFLPFIFSLDDALTKSIAILIASCPCAIQLARPLTLTAFKREALAYGIAVTDWTRAFDLKKLKVICFDKTGTLTEGRPRLLKTTQVTEAKIDDSDINSIIYHLALKSEHPISQSLALEYSKKNVRDIELVDVNEIAGSGINARFSGRFVELKKTIASQSLSTSFWIDGNEMIRFEFDDIIRPEASEMLRDLHLKRGFETWILSGDHQLAVDRFTKEIKMGVSRALGDLNPNGKAQLQNESTAFVGDGLNDAPAMRAAGLGIGFRGSAEASLAVADFHLLKHDLKLIPSLLSAVARARETVHINLIISLIYNALVIILVFYGFFGPILCAVFMPLSSLSVIIISFYRKLF